MLANILIVFRIKLHNEKPPSKARKHVLMSPYKRVNYIYTPVPGVSNLVGSPSCPKSTRCCDCKHVYCVQNITAQWNTKQCTETCSHICSIHNNTWYIFIYIRHCRVSATQWIIGWVVAEWLARRPQIQRFTESFTVALQYILHAILSKILKQF